MAIAIQPDGKIVVGGEFTAIGGGSGSHLARLNSDGTLDTGFNPSVNSYVQAMSIQTDGKIVIGGAFTGTTVWEASKNHIARVNSDGSLDSSFYPNADGYVLATAIRSDGKILVGGAFTSISEVSRNHIALLNSDGSLSLPQGPPGVISISAGRHHSVALKVDGSVSAWGRNDSGQATVPDAVSSDVIAVSAGGSHSIALKVDGSVVAWGDDTYGQSTVPSGLSDVIAVSAGGDHTVVLKSDGSVSAWGDNTYEQSTVPSELYSGLSRVIAISAGLRHTAVLKSNGTVVAWGDDTYGQSTGPSGLSDVIAVSAGGYHTAALKSDGSVVVWGDVISDVTTVPEAASSGVTAISAGEFYMLALKSDGSVVAWGLDINCGYLVIPAEASSGVKAVAAGGYHALALNSDGSVAAWGNGDYSQTTLPDESAFGTIAVSAGGYHTLALNSDGSVVAWGSNGSGQCSVPVAASSGVISIAAGRSHSVALKSDGSVVTWGSNGSGQCSVPVAASSGVIAIAAGGDITAVLKSDGSVVVWGDNGVGQCSVPAAASSGVIAIAAGALHMAALKSDGSVIAWGNNAYGQCSLPAGLWAVRAIASTGYHTVAIKSNGSAVAWGMNNSGQASVPTAASSGVIAIAAGDLHSVALKSDGSVTGWGDNTYDQCSGASGMRAIAAGGNHTVAIRTNGTVAAWGSNSYGQINVPYYAVTVSPTGTVSPGQSVSITSVPGDLDCSWNGVAASGCVSGSIIKGAAVRLTAVLPANTIISSWGTGCSETTSTTCTIDRLTGNTTLSIVTADTAASYSVTASAGANGSLSVYTPSPQTVSYYSTTTFVFGAHAGYHVASVSGCGGPAYTNTSSAVSGYPYETGHIVEDCTVTASFALNSYAVTPSAGTNGSVSPSSAQTISHGSTTSFTFSADSGYHIASVSGCGGSTYTNSSNAVSSYKYDTGSITGACTVAALFAVNTFTVTPSAGANGSVSPSSAQAVDPGSTISFSITPDTGYRISSVSGCGGTLSDSIYTTGVVTEDCTVTASFQANTPPVASADTFDVDLGQTLTVTSPGVLGNDTDANGDALSTALVSGPAHATAFSLNANGSFTYTHDVTKTGEDSFTYKASDPWGGDSEEATVSLVLHTESEADTDLAVSPTSRLFGVEELGNCDSSTPVLFTVKNTGATSRTLETLTLDGPNADEFSLGADVCSGKTLESGSICTVEVKFCPETVGSKAANLLIPSDDPETPVLSAFLHNHESEAEEARRRLPPVLYSLSVPEEMTENQTYTLTWSLLGYDEGYQSSIVFFDCTGITDGTCGNSYGSQFAESGNLSPQESEPGNWTYNGARSKKLTYTYAFTVPALSQGKEIVVRFYSKDLADADAGKGSLSLLIPGNLSGEYYDHEGRRLLKHLVKP